MRYAFPGRAAACNAAAQSRRLIAHCGLAWDDACLNYHENERTVHTASMWQVRQPIYSSSVGKWKRYEGELAPLRAALEE